MSRYAGERFDMVQAGGGNASIKLDGKTMLIKASGGLLSEIEPGRGYVKVDYRAVLAILESPIATRTRVRGRRDVLVARRVKEAILDSGGRPSIETFLHALLDKYTLHVHPIAVNALACRREWESELRRLADEALFVQYRTPGIELALGLKSALSRFLRGHGKKPEVIFLQNHGLIVTSEKYKALAPTIERVLLKAEQRAGIDLGPYRQVTRISSLIRRATGWRPSVLLSEDRVLAMLRSNNRRLFFLKPFTPDMRVYCGSGAVEITDVDDERAVTEFIKKNSEPPRILLLKDRLFLAAPSLHKAREIEEVLKGHLLLAATTKSRTLVSLTNSERNYLGGWEAEKYRQKL